MGITVQWDPERVLDLTANNHKDAYTSKHPLQHRSLQMGIRGFNDNSVLDKLERAVVRITDMTNEFKSIGNALKAKDLDEANKVLSQVAGDEKPMTMSV